MSARWPRPLFLIVAAFGLALDQVSKAWVAARLPLHEPQPIIPGLLDFTFTHNTGVAFGLFQGEGTLIAVLVVALLLGAIYCLRDINWARLEPNLIGGAICAGALGNLLDRARLGYVVDFVDFHLGPHRWYIFNVADSMISVSVCWLLLRQLTSRK
jgi:signal peptidase II